MPTPRTDETQSDFVSRCIPIVLEDGTAQDDKQAVAVCYSMYKQAKKKERSMSNVNLSADVQTFASTEEKPYDFELVGYTGKVMEKSGWRGIFSLDGMESKGGKVIILREHERDRIVGYGETFKDERGFIVRGKFSQTTKDGIEVAGLLKEGIPLQCSVGIAPESVREAKAGEIINNFAVPQGMQVWDKSYVGEVSICSWGVDTDTSVHSFAKEIEMSDEIKEEIKEEEAKVEETPIEEAPVETEEEKAEAPVEEAEEKPAEEPKKEEEFKFTQSDLDAAVAAERGRVAAIFAADAPIELAKEAIAKGLSEGDAFKFFWQSEKGMKIDALKEMAAEAPVVEVDKAASGEAQMSSELGYMELIAKTKDEQKCSTIEATKFVMKNHPEAYQKFLGK